MRNLNIYNKYRKELYGSLGDENNGFFFIPKIKGYFQVLASTGLGWEHVSFCLYNEKMKLEKRIPKYSEVCKIKEMFFGNEDAYEVHPREEDYINDHPYVLHLWRPSSEKMPLPSKEDLNNEVLVNEEIIERKNLRTRVRTYYSLNWSHLTVEILTKKGDVLERYPTWEEMCIIKDTEFPSNVAVVQIHSELIPYDGHTRHLWLPTSEKLPLPPSYLVGKKKKYAEK